MASKKNKLMKNKRRKATKVVPKTRKELRKEKRQQKKIDKATYYQMKNQTPGKFVINPNKDDVSHKTNKIGLEPKEKVNDSKVNLLTKEYNKEKMQVEKLKEEMVKNRKRQLEEANMDEDKVIKQLEKQLKLNKRKSKSIPKSFATDGLDYILDFCDAGNRESIVQTEKQLLDNNMNNDFENDLALALGKEESDNKEDYEMKSDDEFESYSNSEDNNDNSDVESNASEKSIEDKLSDNESVYSEFDEKSNSETSDIYNDIESDSSPNLKEMDLNENSVDNEIWEDIYGRKRDKHGNVISNNSEKYVPPAVRAKQLEESATKKDKLDRLRKQMKGHMNRLAEHNMHNIASQVEDLYMSNSRNDMNELLSNLMIEAIVAPVMTPDRLVAEHMMLIAILHANVGAEVGAQFLLTLIKKFESMTSSTQDVENKELDNLILMISHLYNFKVYAHNLLYQILNKLSKELTEKNIELILVILRSVGFPLRKADPLALKEFILNLQQRVANTKSENSRVNFMLEILMAIKNNNMNKIPQYDPSYVEHLKKTMKTLIRKGNSVTPFNITLEDLLHADERGKWWVVGSAWSGNADINKPINKLEDSKPMFSETILELAKKQRMNTDVRRNIFCILMTAEDYLDAFEKLHHLGLKNQQEREVIYVIIDCCLQEKKFNPYYALLAQQFCDYDRKFKMTIQYTIWDKLKILDDYSAKQLTNLARFLIHLFINKGLPFSIMKVISFAELDKPTLRLFRQIVIGILLHESEIACLEVFEKISVSPQLQNFKEGLRLFLHHFLLRNTDSISTKESEVKLLKERAELVDKLLISSNSKFVF